MERPLSHFNHLVLDDFLPLALHDQLLAHCLAEEAGFAPTGIYRHNEAVRDLSTRTSLYHPSGLGPFKESFKQHILDQYAVITQALGVAPFAIAKTEVELAAHNDGSFFRPHIDTFSARDGTPGSRDRVISIVYYFHAQPRRFQGGELALFPIGQGGPLLIEPRDNRLVAFPSFAPHEVRLVSVPGKSFGHSRFAVNCWLNRTKTERKAVSGSEGTFRTAP